MRELAGSKDLTGQDWPDEMIELLPEIQGLVDKGKIGEVSKLSPKQLLSLSKDMGHWLRKARPQINFLRKSKNNTLNQY